MGFFKSVGKAFKSAGNTVTNTVTNTVNTVSNTGSNVINTVIRETPKAINVAGQQITDGAGKLTSQAEQFSRNTIDRVHHMGGLSPFAGTKVGYGRHGAWVAGCLEPALNDMDAGSKLAMRAMEQGARSGVYHVARGGDLMAEWVNANYCQIGVSVALGTVFAALLYRPEPSSVATTTAATAPLSATAIVYLAAKETVGAVALGTACDLTAQAFVELIWMAPDVRKAIGEANKKILTDAIAFTLCKSFDVAAGAMIVPQSCAAVVAGVVTTMVAQLACEQTLPNGAREWATMGASGL
jgi:hypothetical protein